MQLTTEQQTLVDDLNAFMVREDSAIIVEGVAGCGKSVLISNFIHQYHEVYRPQLVAFGFTMPHTIMVTATTNAAVNQLQIPTAATIHSFLSLRLVWDVYLGKQKLVQSSNVNKITNTIVFIDECSQIGGDLLYFIERTLLKTGLNNKIVFVGDSAQLPPVHEPKSQIYSKYPIMGQELTHSYRQKDVPDIQKYCLSLREFIQKKIPTPINVPKSKDIHVIPKRDDFLNLLETTLTQNTNTRYVTYTNEDVNNVNKIIRKRLVGTEDFVVGDVVKINKIPDDSGLSVDTMTRIKYISEITYLENIMGRWVTIDAGKFFLPNNYGQVGKASREAYAKLRTKCIQLSFEYAITSYKAQGNTYDYVFVDLSQLKIAKNFWTHFYIAMSRTTKGVFITGV